MMTETKSFCFYRVYYPVPEDPTCTVQCYPHFVQHHGPLEASASINTSYIKWLRSQGQEIPAVDHNQRRNRVGDIKPEGFRCKEKEDTSRDQRSGADNQG